VFRARAIFLRVILVAAVFCSACTSESDQSEPPSKPPADLSNRIDALLETIIHDDGPGASVIIAQRGEIIYERAFGLASLEHGVPISNQTVFNSGSVSKQFTAFAIMRLVQDDRVALDADYRTYLPTYPDWGEVITVGDLVYHTSGLPSVPSLSGLNGDNLRSETTNKTATDLVASVGSLNHTPGDEGSYTNTGYLYLAEILEDETGLSLKDWLDRNVFEVLEMDQTELQDNPYEIVEGLASSYEHINDDWQLGLEFDAQIGASNIVTTPRDLTIWMEYLMSLEERDPELWGLLTEPGQLRDGSPANVVIGGGYSPYAAGLYQLKSDGVLSLAHNGSTQAFLSSVMFVPEHQLSVAIMANTNSNSVHETAQEIIELVLRGDDVSEDVAPEEQNDIQIEGDLVQQAMGAYTLPRALVYQFIGLSITEKTPEQMAFQFRFNPLTNQIELRMDGIWWEPLQTSGESRVRFGGLEVDFSGTVPTIISALGELEFTKGGCDDVFMEALAGEYQNPNLDAAYSIYAEDGQWRIKNSLRGSNSLSCPSNNLIVANWETLSDAVGFSHLEPVVEAGEITAIDLSVANRVRRIRFDRVEP